MILTLQLYLCNVFQEYLHSLLYLTVFNLRNCKHLCVFLWKADLLSK
jgi:hypothetical protein